MKNYSNVIGTVNADYTIIYQSANGYFTDIVIGFNPSNDYYPFVVWTYYGSNSGYRGGRYCTGLIEAMITVIND